MKEYKVLNQQIFEKGNYKIVPVRYSDRYEIMNWRNDQMYHLRQSVLLTKESQDKYFNIVVDKLFDDNKPDQILFSYLECGICIGYGGLVHINWIDKNAEISFLVNPDKNEKEFERHWKIYLSLIEEVAFNELSFHKIFTYAFDLRPKLYPALETSGFLKEAVLKEHCFYSGSYKDVIIHSKINQNIRLREITINDIDLVFEWSNERQTRENSFNSEDISYEEHKQWFERKLKDKNSVYYICEVENTPSAFLRFDINEDKIVIGINLDIKFRGKNLSYLFLSKGCACIAASQNLPIVAYIKSSNIPSIKSFEKAGFQKSREIKINNIDSFEYIWR